MLPNTKANSAVPITSSNSERIADKRESVASQITHKHSADLGIRIAADMQKPDIEYHALSKANDDLTGICLCQPEPKIPRPRNGEQTPYIAAFVSLSLFEMLSMGFDSLLCFSFYTLSAAPSGSSRRSKPETYKS